MQLQFKKNKQLIKLMLLASCFTSGCSTLSYPQSGSNAIGSTSPLPASQVMLPADGQRIGADAILTMSETDHLSGRRQHLNNSLAIVVRTAVQAYIHCYYRRATGHALRVFPEISNAETLMVPGQRLEIQVPQTYRSSRRHAHSHEAFLCLAVEDNLESVLPVSLKRTSLSRLSEQNFDEIYLIYRNLTDGNVVGKVLNIRATVTQTRLVPKD